jgi:hypothetical protein
LIVGKLQLDRCETGRGCGAETLQERALGEKVRKIGGEAWHGGGR